MSKPFTVLAIPNLTVRSQAGDSAGGHPGHARGYAAGYSEGIRQAETEMSDRRAALEAEYAALTAHTSARSDAGACAASAAVAALHARVAPVLADAQDTLAESAFDLAEAILGAELSTGDAGARAAVSRVLSHVNAAAVTSIRMNPGDLSVIDAAISANPNIVFTADPALARGDAVADLPHGWLDARIASASARAREELLRPTGATAA